MWALKGFDVFFFNFLFAFFLVPIIFSKTSDNKFCSIFTTDLEFAVETLKTFILSMALVDNHLTAQTAVHLSRLELEFQVVHYFF